MHNAIMKAVVSYSKGMPVVVLTPDESVLHGEDTLKAIVDLGCGLHVHMVRDIDRAAFEERSTRNYSKQLGESG
jgi:hypothetical protein